MLRTASTTVADKRESPDSADIFSKCREFLRPRELAEAGLYLYFETFGDRTDCSPAEVRIEGRRILMFGSNDYLSLTVHPEVVAAAREATSRYGTGCSGSRLLNGTLDLHVRLEESLARLVRKEAAIIFSTGFQANFAALSVLGGKGDVLLCDHNLHASLVEGTLKSAARVVRFRHNDTDHLAHGLAQCREGERTMVVTEGVFSMEGDVADLASIVPLARQHGARIYVDEAHGLGVLGETGAGAAEAAGVLDDVDVVMGTFSKSFASVGGFIASSRSVTDYLKHIARPFVFSASLPAASVATVQAALDVMHKEPERRANLLRVAALLRRNLAQAGFCVLEGTTPIVPIVLDNELDVCRLCKALLADGLYVNPVLKPAAVNNLLRISCTAAHTETHVDRLVTTLSRLVRELNIAY
jgi:8-amino-7-oxononanoate synthase